MLDGKFSEFQVLREYGVYRMEADRFLVETGSVDIIDLLLWSSHTD